MSGFATSGGGAVTLISSSVLGAGLSSVTFSAIPGTFNHLRIVAQARSLQATAVDTIGGQFNGDTGNNYDSQWILGALVAAPSAGTLMGGSTFVAGDIAAASTTAAEAGAMVVDIPNYAGTTFRKQVTSLSGYADGGGPNGTSLAAIGAWRNTAAITSILLKLGSANFATGSAFYLYGIT